VNRHCKHKEIFFIPLGNVDWSSSDAEWCAVCGQLRVKDGESIKILNHKRVKS